MSKMDLVRHLVDAQQLDQYDEDAYAEVQIARGGGAHGGGQWQSALPHGQHERALALQYEIRDMAVAASDHEAKKKSRNLQGHIEIVRRQAPRLNRPKTLTPAHGGVENARFSRARIQTISMHSDVLRLKELQEVDARIAALRAEIAALPKEVAAIEAKLAGSKARVEAAQAAIKTDDTARRKHESNIKDQQDKISKYRDQSLNVKTNQEYRALLTEIEHAEKEIARLEDSILEIMVAADTRKETLKQAEATLKAATAENEKEKEHARQQTAEDEKELAGLSEQRQQLRAGVGEDALRHYDRVLKLRGSALAPVHDNQMCGICRVILRPQVYQDVMKGEEIIHCDSCQRILYYVPPPPNEEALQEAGAEKKASSDATTDAAAQQSAEAEEVPTREAAAQ